VLEENKTKSKEHSSRRSRQIMKNTKTLGTTAVRALLASLALLWVAAVTPAFAATVSTDQSDYAPGSTATITGSGFTASESVKLQVLHADGTPSTGSDHDPWTVTADDNGGFTTTWFVCTDDCVGSTLQVTAAGLSSGATAQATFKDGANLGSVRLVNVTSSSGGCVKYAAGKGDAENPDNWFVQEGQTYTLTFAGPVESTCSPLSTVTIQGWPKDGTPIPISVTGPDGSGQYAGTVTLPFKGVCLTTPLTYCGKPPTFVAGVDGLREAHLVAGTFTSDCGSVVVDEECAATGAACDKDGNCHEALTKATADANGWTYQGDGSTCATAPCGPVGCTPSCVAIVPGTCPGDQLPVPHDSGKCCAVVNFTPPTAVDNCGNSVNVTCDPPSGSCFPVGVTTVTCKTDKIGDCVDQCRFTVTVKGTICGKKFYDANANGTDNGEPGIAGWKITIADGASINLTVFTDTSGKYCADVPVGTYTVTEVPPSSSWGITKGPSCSVNVTPAACDQTCDFGNVCTAKPANGLTLGFWSNKNGQQKLQANDPAWRTLLNGLNLRNANGTPYTVPGGSFSSAYSNFRTWLLNATAVNMAYMLSAQLAANELDSAYNNLNPATAIVVPACLSTGAGANVIDAIIALSPGAITPIAGPLGVPSCSAPTGCTPVSGPCETANGYITIGSLQSLAVASLPLYPLTTSAGPVRTYLEAIKDLLDEINNNGNAPCPSAYNCGLTTTIAPTAASCPFTSPY